jgi:hypothetical protein
MGGRRPDDWSRIGNFHISCTHVWTMLTVVWMVEFELRFLPYILARPDGKPHRPDSCINLPLLWTWKESEADRSLIGVRTGCWDFRTDASWNRSFSIQYRVRTENHVIRTDDAWSVGCLDGMARCLDGWNSEQNGRPDGMTRRPDGWQGTEFLLTFKQRRVFWECSE